MKNKEGKRKNEADEQVACQVGRLKQKRGLIWMEQVIVSVCPALHIHNKLK